jgi:K+-sensing histidine kinase KdpD
MEARSSRTLVARSAAFRVLSTEVPRYGFAAVVMCVAFGLRLLLNPLVGTGIPYMAAFLGIAVTARYAGFGPAICSLILGGFLACYFFLTPIGSFAVTAPGDATGLVFYFVVGMIIVLLSEWQNHACKIAEERQVRLAAEVQKHRQTAEELRLQRDRLVSAEEGLQQTQSLLQERVKDLETEVTNRMLTENLLRDERNRLAVAERELQRTKDDLLQRLTELQRFEEAVVGRELKMVKMEKELGRLREENAALKETNPYAS